MKSQVLNLLKKNYRKVLVPVPSYWNYPDISYSGKTRKVDFFELMINYFETYLLKAQQHPPLKDISQAVIYGALIRTTTAFDFDRDRRLLLNDRFGLRETGTILRMFLLFPLLLSMGVNVIYLLPITASSRQYRKGKAPSPYACKNFFKIDEELYDPMLGPFSEEKLEMLFREYVEVCHQMGLSVMVDFIPRTAARDNDLILDHPDWFYWIKKDQEGTFRPPFIEGVPVTAYDKKYVKQLYSSPQTREFLKMFTKSPDKIDKARWNKLRSRIRSGNITNFMEPISREFGVTTVPGFSDVINDIQPLWTETSFLRMFDDLPLDSKKYIPKAQPPYVLFDIIKSSKAPGTRPNKELWDLLSSVLPYWQKQYHIDGVRIDMAHALPLELESRILKNTLKVNKKFILIAEELDNKNSVKASKAGYHAFIGNFWAVEPRWSGGYFKKVFEEDIPFLKIPLFACSETHDTPRTVTRPGKIRFYYFSLVLNYFLPRTITFINTGFELGESHPMNKGLDSAFANVHTLPFWDLNYGKMALFDYTCLHWQRNNKKAVRLMEHCRDIRRKYPEIKKFNNFQMLKVEHPFIFSYMVRREEGQGVLLFLINSDMRADHKVKFNLPLPPVRTVQPVLSSFLFYKKKRITDSGILKRIRIRMNDLHLKMKRSEILILLIQHA